jgi:SecD/SecF fusion protein
MNRSCLVVLALGSAVVLLIALLTGGLYLAGVFRPRPDVHVVGGTILTYEVDDADLAADVRLDDLTAAVKRRVDPADLHNILVRAAGEHRIEVVVPRGPANQGALVEQVKALLATVGILEFRVLANDHNDRDAQEAARKVFTAARTDKKREEELMRAASAGLPPPPPLDADGVGLFDTPLGKFTFSWLELGPSERLSQGLDNGAEADARAVAGLEKKLAAAGELPASERISLERGRRWQQAADARARGEPFVSPSGLLLYSRAVLNPREDPEKKVEYFVLGRDPEPGKEITGNHLIQVQADTDPRGKPAVRFGVDDVGANLFRELTSANRPSADGFRTMLAIVLDGQVMAAAALEGTIGGEVQITGNFTTAEVDRIVAILRAGALPARLKPQPVSEAVIAPAAQP